VEIETVSNVTITKSTSFPSRKGFGVPLIVGYHTAWLPKIKSFSSLAELVTAGIATTHPIYRAASALKSQNPAPTRFLVANRSIYTQVIKLSPQIATEGHVYEFDVVTPDGVVNAIEYVVPGAATLTSIGTAIAALIDALADVTAVSVVGVITCTATAGKFLSYESLPLITELEVEDTTADPGITADLTAIEVYAKKNRAVFSFYGLCVDQLGQAAFLAVAAWVGARKLVFAGRMSDSEIADPAVTDDVFSTRQDASDERTIPMFAQRSTGDFRDAAILGRMLPKEPGSATYAFKTLTNVLTDNLGSEEESTVRSKGGNTYTETSSLNLTYPGQTPSGEYVDVTIGLDFTHARIQEDVFGYIASQEIVPYTQAGMNAIGAIVQARLDKCTKDPNKIFSEDTPPVVEVPEIADVDTSDKSTRVLRNVVFRATLSGAIHSVSVSGTVSV
jgi:hypothetical protein